MGAGRRTFASGPGRLCRAPPAGWRARTQPRLALQLRPGRSVIAGACIQQIAPRRHANAGRGSALPSAVDCCHAPHVAEPKSAGHGNGDVGPGARLVCAPVARRIHQCRATCNGTLRDRAIRSRALRRYRPRSLRSSPPARALWTRLHRTRLQG